MDGDLPYGGINILLRGGDYLEDLSFGRADSGDVGAPVTYRAYGNEEVHFLGGTEIPISGFKTVTELSGADASSVRSEVRSYVKAVKLSDYGITDYGKIEPWGYGTYGFYDYNGPAAANNNKTAEWMNFTPRSSEPQLFLNDEAFTLARYPNGSDMLEITGCTDVGNLKSEWQWISSSNGSYINGSTGEPLMAWEDVQGPTVYCSDEEFIDRMASWTDADDMWTYGFWMYNWADMASSVKAMDASNGSFTLKYPYTMEEVRAGQKFYVFNLLEELDTEGEWYLDRSTGILYAYLPEDAKGSVVFTTGTDTFVDMNYAENIRFKNIDFVGNRVTAVKMNNCKNITFEGCTFDKLGWKAIEMSGNDSEGCTFLSNTFTNISQGGIETTGGDGATLKKAGNLIENNYFERYATKGNGYCTAFTLRGVGDKARYNHITDSDGGAFGQHASGTIVEYNEIDNVMRTCADAGVSYAYQNFTGLNRIARHNYLHDIGRGTGSGSYVNGFYQDGGSNGLTVHSNVFKNFHQHGVFFNGGNFNKAYNNVMIDVSFLGALTSIMYGYDGEIEGTTPLETIDHDYYRNLVANYPEYADYISDVYGEEALSIYDGAAEHYPKYNEIANNLRIGSTNDAYFAPFSDLKWESVSQYNTIEPNPEYGTSIFEDYASGNLSIKDDALNSIRSEIPDFEAPDFERIGTYGDKLKTALGDSIAVMIYSDMLYSGGYVNYVDPWGSGVTPIREGGSVYVPLEAVGEQLGGSFADMTLTLSGHVLTANEDNVLCIDGTATDKKAEFTDDILYVPAEIFTDMGIEVTTYFGRIAVIGDSDTITDTYPDGSPDYRMYHELARQLS